MIKLVLSDLDGCLTNGTYIRAYSNTVNTIEYIFGKQFNTRDFHGMHLLHEKCIECGVITGADDRITDMQFKASAPFAHVITDVGSIKYRAVSGRFVERIINPIKWEEIAYIGDDIQDIPLLEAVGMAACPADAEGDVISYINYRNDAWVTTRNGGQGCVREFINLILKINRV